MENLKRELEVVNAYIGTFDKTEVLKFKFQYNMDIYCKHLQSEQA